MDTLSLLRDPSHELDPPAALFALASAGLLWNSQYHDFGLAFSYTFPTISYEKRRKEPATLDDSFGEFRTQKP